MSKGLSLRRGYAYLMKKPKEDTMKALKGVKTRIADRKFYQKAYKKQTRWYYGWIAFTEPINTYDAMNAGLVPIFRDGGVT